jgi:hypothetical protein
VSASPAPPVRDGVWRAVRLAGSYTNDTPTEMGCPGGGETDDLSTSAS